MDARIYKINGDYLHFYFQIFGPVQSIFKFETFEEVLDRANNTTYGLAAGIFTTNINTALQYSKHVEAGNVW